MKQVLEYIVQNYAWFFGAIILILLAIIGYYADKTNFGQGKTEENKKDDNKTDDLSKADNQEDMEDLYAPLESSAQNNELVEEITTQSNFISNVEENNVEVVETSDGASNPNALAESTSGVFSKEAVDKFNDEFNSILPEKELISSDLLSDIEDLELDKTQKIELSDIANLNNIELPKIKKFVPEEEDIWKF